MAQIFLLKLDEKKKVVPQEVELLLSQFGEQFQKPKGLPLSRDYDHAIQLFTGTKPINLRPYRYFFEQMNAIEEIMAEMLKAETVAKSVSPFASLVLLVKKKKEVF